MWFVMHKYNAKTNVTWEVIACVAWQFLSKLSALRKWENRDNRDNPKAARSLGEKTLKLVLKNGLNRQATQARGVMKSLSIEVNGKYNTSLKGAQLNYLQD